MMSGVTEGRGTRHPIQPNLKSDQRTSADKRVTRGNYYRWNVCWQHISVLAKGEKSDIAARQEESLSEAQDT